MLVTIFSSLNTIFIIILLSSVRAIGKNQVVASSFSSFKGELSELHNNAVSDLSTVDIDLFSVPPFPTHQGSFPEVLLPSQKGLSLLLPPTSCPSLGVSTLSSFPLWSGICPKLRDRHHSR